MQTMENAKMHRFALVLCHLENTLSHINMLRSFAQAFRHPHFPFLSPPLIFSNRQFAPDIRQQKSGHMITLMLPRTNWERREIQQRYFTKCAFVISMKLMWEQLFPNGTGKRQCNCLKGTFCIYL